jgi:hypothetical protein
LSYELDPVPFVQARWYSPATGRAVRVGVLHDMEYTERPDAAEIIAHDFAVRPADSKASAHDCIDNNSVIQCVKDHDIAYAAPPCNSNGLHWELAGFGRQTRDEWLDDYGKALLARASDRIAQYALKWALPVVHLTNAQLKAGARGFVGHGQVSAVYGLSSHTDPGPGFPWDVFMLALGTRVTARRKPQPGDRRYSNFFHKYITLVHYIDDSHWSFTVDGRPGVLEAQAKWADMPKGP